MILITGYFEVLDDFLNLFLYRRFIALTIRHQGFNNNIQTDTSVCYDEPCTFSADTTIKEAGNKVFVQLDKIIFRMTENLFTDNNIRVALTYWCLI
jgi:hypothetical protein